MTSNFNPILLNAFKEKSWRSAGNVIHLHPRGVRQRISARPSAIPSLLRVTKDGFGLSKNASGGQEHLERFRCTLLGQAVHSKLEKFYRVFLSFFKSFNYILFKGKIFIFLPQYFFPDLWVFDLDLFENFFFHQVSINYILKLNPFREPESLPPA